MDTTELAAMNASLLELTNAFKLRKGVQIGRELYKKVCDLYPKGHPVRVYEQGRLYFLETMTGLESTVDAPTWFEYHGVGTLEDGDRDIEGEYPAVFRSPLLLTQNENPRLQSLSARIQYHRQFKADEDCLLIVGDAFGILYGNRIYKNTSQLEQEYTPRVCTGR